MDPIIATMTLARDRDEQHRLLLSLNSLSSLGLPIVLADGGSLPAFTDAVTRIPNVEVLEPLSAGLVGQIAAALARARDRGARHVFYTEPDKLEFFRDRAVRFLRSIPEDPALGVALTSRTPLAFGTFPAMQRAAERAINTVMSELTGVTGDYCYGPFLVDSRLLDRIEDLDRGIGWGWRFEVFLRALASGRTIRLIEGDHRSPDEQLWESDRDRIYRIRQLSDNVLGVLSGLAPVDDSVKTGDNGVGV